MESLILAATGVGVIGLAIGAAVAADFHGWSSGLHIAADARAAGWPNWVRIDEWGRSVLAVRLYGSGLAFACLMLMAGGLPRRVGTIGEFVEVAAFLGFAAIWMAAMIGSLRFGWRSRHRWRYVAVWNIGIFALEFVIVGLSIAISASRS